MRGLSIFNVQHLSLHDGPGVRTTCFLKGCSLRCLWCHNPESMERGKTLQFAENSCIGCRACENACPVGVHHFSDKAPQHLGEAHARYWEGEGMHWLERGKCQKCGRCAQVCNTEALRLLGETKGEELLEELLRDKRLYEISGGGVTFSGGEPLLQWRGLQEMAERLKREQVHITVDTAGNVPWEAFEACIPYTDLFLFDLKQMDPKKHRLYTGAGNERILENLARVSGRAPFLVRMPIIHKINDEEEHIRAAGRYLSGLTCRPQKTELLSYHEFGVQKAREAGMEQEKFEPPRRECMERFKRILEDYGLEAEIS